MEPGIRVFTDSVFTNRVRVSNNETGEEIPYVTELKIHCLPNEAITLEMRVICKNGFDISVLPENVTIIIEEGK